MMIEKIGRMTANASTFRQENALLLTFCWLAFSQCLIQSLVQTLFYRRRGVYTLRVGSTGKAIISGNLCNFYE